MFKNKNKDYRDLSDRQIHSEFVAKKNKKSRSFVWVLSTSVILILGIVVIGIYLGLTHPYFYVDNIEISGNRDISDEEIIETAAIQKNQNIFRMDASKIRTKIQGMDKVLTVKTSKIIPDTIRIEVTEKTDLGYIHVDNGYLIITGDLKIDRHVPELSEEDKDKLIKFSNAGYSTLAIGYKVSNENKEIEFIKALIDQELLKVTDEIDFGSETNELKLRVNHDTIVDFGKIEDIEYKFSLIEKIMVDLKQKGIKAKEIIINHTQNPVVVKE
ncbi:MAG: FtsQ-type POTRA domain-containing protein [Tissierellia bacterium]|nr:FtsQ-type POTRA domain-containing protein [Tissierellia bacterium]